ncbi:hypothetical protein, partial [Bacteroides sp. 224]|uniref:hypothetical protein n=1 Tax=Bacteroides sp. 224 TaxID=2302936 RepID=UPI0013D23234
MTKKHKPLKDKYIGLVTFIYSLPPTVPTDAVGSGKDCLLKEANDKRLVVNASTYSPLEIVCALVFFVATFYICYYEPISFYYKIIELIPARVDNNDYSFFLPAHSDTYIYTYESFGLDELKKSLAEEFPIVFLGGFISCSIFLYWGYVAAKRCRDCVIFDRTTSMVTYHHTFGLLTTVAPFNEVLFQPRPISLYDPIQILGFRLPGTVSWAVLSLGHVYEITSLCVWFMDKNRPLPPG